MLPTKMSGALCEVCVMNNTLLGGLCLLVCVTVIIVTRWLWSDADEEINKEWERYKRDEVNRK